MVPYLSKLGRRHCSGVAWRGVAGVESQMNERTHLEVKCARRLKTSWLWPAWWNPNHCKGKKQTSDCDPHFHMNSPTADFQWVGRGVIVEANEHNWQFRQSLSLPSVDPGLQSLSFHPRHLFSRCPQVWSLLPQYVSAVYVTQSTMDCFLLIFSFNYFIEANFNSLTFVQDTHTNCQTQAHSVINSLLQTTLSQ